MSKNADQTCSAEARAHALYCISCSNYCCSCLVTKVSCSVPVVQRDIADAITAAGFSTGLKAEVKLPNGTYLITGNTL